MVKGSTTVAEISSEGGGSVENRTTTVRNVVIMKGAGHASITWKGLIV